MKKSMAKVLDVYNKLMYILNTEQKRYGLFLLAMSFVGALLETIGVSAIVPLIQVLMTPEQILEKKWLGNIFDFFNIDKNEEIILIFVIGIILVYIFKNLFFIFLSWVRSVYACKIQRELSVYMMKAYMDKGYPFFLTKNTSELMRGVFNDTSSVYNFINQLFRTIVDCLTVALICIYIFVTDTMLALGMVVLAGLCLLIVFGYFKNKMQRYGQESRKYSAVVNQQAIQAFQGIKEVIVMRKQKYFVKNFENAWLKQRKPSVGHAVGTESPAYIIEAICITGLLGLVCFRVILGGENVETMFPTLSAFAVGAFRILPALGKISSGFNTLNFYLVPLDHMYRQLKDTEEKGDTLENIYLVDKNADKEFVEFKNELKIDQICWRYAEELGYVLKDLSLVIKKGESVAFIGHSGAGKTTLADIMLGLLKPQSGEVTIDGKDIFTFGDEWSNIMGYVPQSVYLPDDSIRKNIAFGIPDKNIDDEKIWDALEQAQLKEFVESLPQRLDTPIGERGIRFSGGQRQRVAIARALYNSPDILILDEATASLDNETENAVMEAIEGLQGKITLIIIAHRLTTIKKCDRIYEVDNGVVVERRKSEIFEESAQ
ncbi:MAG: ABC transporter ATP-binding protein [Lachnospiraceae bacterium]|nr:ABC transporter ATP-binding protein [Lachnospiraceae bacterium]